MSKKTKGIIFYQGASKVDGAPIVVIGTFGSRNEKTGTMIQTWIIRSDISPVDAVKTGDDKSLCGSCPHRHYSGGACYVLPFQAPRSIYEAFKKGIYDVYDPQKHDALIGGKKVRFGAYGDPAAVPYEVWKNIHDKCLGVTGYTHHYGAKHFDNRLLEFCMVSVETPKQTQKLNALGIQTFRVKTADSPLLPNEVVCLNESKGISCQVCMMCNGQTKSIVINVHGQKHERFTKKYGNIIVKQAA